MSIMEIRKQEIEAQLSSKELAKASFGEFTGFDHEEKISVYLDYEGQDRICNLFSCKGICFLVKLF